MDAIHKPLIWSIRSDVHPLKMNPWCGILSCFLDVGYSHVFSNSPWIDCGELIFAVSVYRYADPCDAPPRHTSDAGECSATVLLRVFYIRHNWCSTLGRGATKSMFLKYFRKHYCKLVSFLDFKSSMWVVKIWVLVWLTLSTNHISES